MNNMATCFGLNLKPTSAPIIYEYARRERKREREREREREEIVNTFYCKKERF